MGGGKEPKPKANESGGVTRIYFIVALVIFNKVTAALQEDFNRRHWDASGNIPQDERALFKNIYVFIRPTEKCHWRSPLTFGDFPSLFMFRL